MMNILITGANGFIGSRLASALAKSPEIRVLSAVRRRSVASEANAILIPEISSQTNWSEALVGQHIVIHTAARSHVMKDNAADPLAEYRLVNVDGTLNLARQASQAGVRRFIFLSSIKVNGEQTSPGKPFASGDEPAPEDAYGISKLEAEIGLKRISLDSDMELVIIRPPLVYGPGVKGNFATIIRSIKWGLPIPLGADQNYRSLVGIDNLVDLIVRCTEHPAAADQVFLVSDREDLSTKELLQELAGAMKKRVFLIPLPRRVILLGAKIFGKQAQARRLLGSLQVDIEETCERLDWEPPESVRVGLTKC